MIGNKTSSIKQRQNNQQKQTTLKQKIINGSQKDGCFNIIQEQELQRIRKFKAMELQKQKLKMEMKELSENNKNNVPQKKTEDQTLRGYGEKLKKETQIKMKKKLENIKLVESNSPSSQEDNDSQNLKYFMSVVGLPQYFELLVQNKVTSLAKLRQIDQNGAKKIGIPLKDMIKINKKLRSMGY